jgi:DNA-binding transcriptional ArsR family regulator
MGHMKAGDDDAVWKALADPTRRGILDLLRARARTTGELAEAFPVTRFAVMKHLEVLVAAGLVVVERRGRERFNHLNTVPSRALHRRWIRPFEEHRADALLRLKKHLEKSPRKAGRK